MWNRWWISIGIWKMHSCRRDDQGQIGPWKEDYPLVLRTDELRQEQHVQTAGASASGFQLHPQSLQSAGVQLLQGHRGFGGRDHGKRLGRPVHIFLTLTLFGEIFVTHWLSTAVCDPPEIFLKQRLDQFLAFGKEKSPCQSLFFQLDANGRDGFGDGSLMKKRSSERIILP